MNPNDQQNNQVPNQTFTPNTPPAQPTVPQQPMAPTPPQPPTTPNPMAGGGMGNPLSPPPESKSFLSKFKKIPKKAALIVVVAVVVLLGGSAAAYYGVIVPNKPENVFKKSVENTLKMEKFSGKGSLSYKGKEDSVAVVADYSLQGDTTTNALNAKVDVSVSGFKLPLELRSVDKAVYMKVGDLSSVSSLLSAYVGADAGPYVKQLSSQVSNKWIEFDESLLKTAGADQCSAAFASKVSDEDMKQIFSLYDDNSFIDIKNTSSDTIDGRKLTKAEIGIDDAKAKSFGEGTKNLDLFKKFSSCNTGAASSGSETLADSSGEYKLNVWLDTSKKEIVKIAIDVSDETGSMTFDFTFNDDEVNIQKPEGAIPAVDFLNSVTPLLGTI